MLGVSVVLVASCTAEPAIPTSVTLPMPVVNLGYDEGSGDLRCSVSQVTPGWAYAFTWTRDGEPFRKSRKGTFDDDSIAARHARSGKTWTCRVHAWTGTEASPEASGSVVMLEQPLILAFAPPGTFTMGSPPGEPCRYPNETQRRVTLTRGFHVGIHEVTVAQFREVMGYAPSFQSDCPTCPVDGASWDDAAAFTNALSQREGLEPCYRCAATVPPRPLDPSRESGGCRFMCSSPADPYACEGYRLPTEAEWEYAARAGSTGAFTTGGSFPPDHVCSEMCERVRLTDGHDLGDLGWFCGNSRDGQREAVHPVGQKLPNAWGLYDVHGNVDEWCNEATDRSDYPGDETDPVGLPSGNVRVLRGGTHDWGSYLLRLGARWFDPHASCRAPHIGFRVVRTVQE